MRWTMSKKNRGGNIMEWIIYHKLFILSTRTNLTGTQRIPGPWARWHWTLWWVLLFQWERNICKSTVLGGGVCFCFLEHIPNTRSQSIFHAHYDLCRLWGFPPSKTFSRCHTSLNWTIQLNITKIISARTHNSLLSCTLRFLLKFQCRGGW